MLMFCDFENYSGGQKGKRAVTLNLELISHVYTSQGENIRGIEFSIILQLFVGAGGAEW